MAARLLEESLPEFAFNGTEADYEQTALEIGFGSGEHLLQYAKANPRTLCLGAETFRSGIAKLLGKLRAKRLENVRVFGGDALDLLADLPNDSLAKLFILYPDPWPKRRHRKRRLVNRQFLEESCLRVLKPGAELLVVTDWLDYVRQIHEGVDETRFRFAPPPPPIATRYRQKAAKEGRESVAIRLIKL